MPSQRKIKQQSVKEDSSKLQDKRCGKIVVLAHCILNQNSRVSGLARYSAVIDEVVDLLREYGVGLLQMPCPELTYAGARRPSKTREEYDTPSYRTHCRRITTSIVDQLEQLAENNVKVLAILGVKGSPSCGVGASPDETGILIEELNLELGKRGLIIPLHIIDSSEIAADVEWLDRLLRRA
jgi:predicted secreted protein